MVSGVVGNSSDRPLVLLSFAFLPCPILYAPLIFVNGTVTKAVQILSYLWPEPRRCPNIGTVIERGSRQQEEVWCDTVAAELLVPP